ncbi:MFS-type efflux pump MFS1 [Paramyrothecium foliicola]|nr:MFS-type efflux pump MFS1 [Paramyrothecium foliicola]
MTTLHSRARTPSTTDEAGLGRPDLPASVVEVVSNTLDQGEITPKKRLSLLPLHSVTAIHANVDPDTPKQAEGPAPVRPGPAFQQEAESNYKPKTVKFWLIMLSNFVSLFMVALDRTILSTAVPSITNDFKSLGDIGWYGSAYMLTTAAFQLLYGRIYRFYRLKPTVIYSIAIFEAGSLICGAAPSSRVFILGRAVAGLGSAGIFTGGMMIIIPMVPLHKRPIFQSAFGLIFGIASVAGPLIGGAFAEKATWRWCFYMNIPIGAVASAFLFFLLKSPSLPRDDVSVWKQVVRLDPLGTAFFIPSVACLVLALQWGGSSYSWHHWRVVLLLCTSAVTAVAFGITQVMMPDSASLPARIIKQRSMLAGTWFVFFLSGALMLCIFYVPLWFQASQGVKPIDSGVYMIPMALSMVVASFVSSVLIKRIGYYVPSMLVCSCLMSIGLGLLTTLNSNTGPAQWIAYQFLVGFGVGFGMQTASLAVQATLPKQDISTGIAITFFAQQLAGAIFVSVGQTILSNLLVSRLGHDSDLDPKAILRSGATEVHSIVPERLHGVVLDAYNDACTRIFIVAAVLSCVQLLCALRVEWKNIRKSKQGPGVEKSCEPGPPQDRRISPEGTRDMDASSSNALFSSQKTAQVQAVLHPLVLLTISDYITRHTLREQQGPIVGALLGQQNGREITIEHAFECHMREAPEVEGGYLIDGEKFGTRLEQMTTVHKDRRLDFVGWYTLLPSTGPTPTILPVHRQLLEGWNEAAILLGFHPEEVLHHSVGGKLPLTIYESNYEVDDPKFDQDDEDKKMDDGEPKLKLKFREVPYSVETDDTEMISMNYVAGAGGSASAGASKEERPSRSIESNGKGKRRLVENLPEEKKESSEDDNLVLSREEDEMIASLTARANAIKMLHSRIQVITRYLERLPPSFVDGQTSEPESMDTDSTTPSLTVLRQIQALVSRLDLVIPSDKEAFETEVLHETNDVNLINLLNDLVQGASQARDVTKKFNVIEGAKSFSRRGGGDFQGGGSFNLAGAGDILL